MDNFISASSTLENPGKSNDQIPLRQMSGGKDR